MSKGWNPNDDALEYYLSVKEPLIPCQTCGDLRPVSRMFFSGADSADKINGICDRCERVQTKTVGV